LDSLLQFQEGDDWLGLVKKLRSKSKKPSIRQRSACGYSGCGKANAFA
jgi:hypothetical protein